MWSWNICPSYPSLSSCVCCLVWTVVLMSPTARLLSHWWPSCWALLWILSASWRLQTEIKTLNALQQFTLCRVALHPVFCSFLVNTKTHFCFSCSSLGQQTPPEASTFLNSYILYLYHCCASSLNLNDAKNKCIYFVGLMCEVILQELFSRWPGSPKLLRNVSFFGTSPENSLSHSHQPTSSRWEIRKKTQFFETLRWRINWAASCWCSFISTNVSC